MRNSNKDQLLGLHRHLKGKVCHSRDSTKELGELALGVWIWLQQVYLPSLTHSPATSHRAEACPELPAFPPACTNMEESFKYTAQSHLCPVHQRAHHNPLQRHTLERAVCITVSGEGLNTFLHPSCWHSYINHSSTMCLLWGLSVSPDKGGSDGCTGKKLLLNFKLHLILEGSSRTLVMESWQPLRSLRCFSCTPCFSVLLC